MFVNFARQGPPSRLGRRVKQEQEEDSSNTMLFPVDDCGQVGDGDAEDDEEGAEDLHVGGAPAEVELVDAGREDGLEGDQDHPDRGRDERDGVEVDVVLGGNSTGAPRRFRDSMTFQVTCSMFYSGVPK